MQRTLNLIVTGVPSNTLLIAIKNLPTVSGGSIVQSGVAEAGSVPIERANNRKEQSAFDGALDLYREAKYREAATSLSSFLDLYPKSVLVATAHFYLGACHYVLKNYQAAISILQTMAGRHPNHARAPEALLVVAGSQFDLNQRTNAKATLEKILKNYPGTPAAQSAQARLKLF